MSARFLGISFRKVNCFFLRGAGGKLLAIDAGWPCALREYQRAMKAAGLRFQDIALAVVTHFHIDHAGLVSDFLAEGISCLAFEHQLAHIDAMERTVEKNRKNYLGYRRVDRSRLTVIPVNESRAFLLAAGFDAECVVTDGHSDDSVSVVSGDEAVVGDLTLPAMLMENDVKSLASWERLKTLGVRTARPGHAPTLVLE